MEQQNQFLHEVVITFYPDWDKQEFIDAAQEYQKIWYLEGEKIVHVIENVSGLKFVEKRINAIVYQYSGGSYPLRFGFNKPINVKKRGIAHELCHRIVGGNDVLVSVIDKKEKDLLLHKQIFLILYDVLTDLWGEDIAKEEVESQKPNFPDYVTAWDWALSFKNREERQKKFKETLETRSL